MGADNYENHASPAPALQVVILGAGGGPQEHNTTAFLVRSLSSGWRKGSIVAVDAGVHLSAIQRILEDTQPPDLGSEELPIPHTLTTGPFAGLELPFKNSSANAAHIARNLIDTYLITHPHLDHIAGFVINTAGLPGTRPKRLAGLPSTINAFKAHIFNNVIWPNLSDENNGAGLVTYMRLVEGGSPAMGEEGYLEISDGLAVKTWSVSHGHCIERHSHRGSTISRYGSMDASSAAAMSMSISVASPRGFPFHPGVVRAGSMGPQGCEGATTPGSAGGGQSICVYDSCAYFIRDVATPKEVLIFGDVEADSVSLSPRNLQIWQDAAPKVAVGNLAAILIECSYDDSRPTDRLFGHLTPGYLMEELKVLAGQVEMFKAAGTSPQQGQGGLQVPTPGTPTSSTPLVSQVGPGIPGAQTGTLSRKKRKRGLADLDDPLLRRPRHPSIGLAGNDELPLSPKSQMKAPTSNSRSASGGSIHHLDINVPAAPAVTTGSLAAYSGLGGPGAGGMGGGGGGMGMGMGVGGSRRGSNTSSGGTDSDTPHIATPTAELTLRDYEGGFNAHGGPGSDVDLNFHGGHGHQPRQHGHSHSHSHGVHSRGPSNGHTGSFMVGGTGGVPGIGVSGAGGLDAGVGLGYEQNVLKGVKVVVIHVKDKQDDKTPVGEVILEELRKHEEDAGLGCEFLVSFVGQSLVF